MNLECQILDVLVASPRAIPAKVIAGFLRDATLADIERALRSLEQKGDVKGTANQDTGSKYKETDDGRLRVS